MPTMAVGLAIRALMRGLARGFTCGTRCGAVSHAWRDRPHPAASAGPRLDARGACDRCGEYPTGPRSSPSPRTGACAFGGELSARQASLAERISGTPEPTGVTTEPFYTAFRGVPHVIAATKKCSFHSAGDRRLEQLNTITQPNHIRVAAETATTQSNRWSQY